RDFSTNLLGTFQPEDRCWTFIARQEYFGEAWQEGEEVEIPTGDECERQEKRGAFYLKAGELDKQEAEYLVNGTEKIKAVCHIIHTPVRCNFWHFSVRWLPEKAEAMPTSKSVKNMLKTQVRRLILENAVLKAPEFSAVPLEKYLKQ
ncbi:MAG: hypothetical protein AAB316_03225, partial [Bacteroidota bacterium]